MSDANRTAIAKALHPLCDLLPRMRQADFEALVEDIRRHGVRQPVTVTADGEVLDGRHRYLACEGLGIECPAVVWDGEGDPVDLILSANVHRRHLTASQLACVAASVLAREAAEDRPHGGRAAEAVAERIGVSARHVYSAARLQREAPAIFVHVADGRVSLQHAVRSLSATEHYRRRMLGLIAEGASPRDVVRRAMCDEARPRIDTEFSEILPPCDVRQDVALARSILEEGCLHALVVWRQTGILLDGHRRLRACEQLGAPYAVRYRDCEDREEAEAVLIDAQLGRSNLSQFSMGELELVAARALCGMKGVPMDSPAAVEACAAEDAAAASARLEEQRSRWMAASGGGA